MEEDLWKIDTISESEIKMRNNILCDNRENSAVSYDFPRETIPLCDFLLELIADDLEMVKHRKEKKGKSYDKIIESRMKDAVTEYRIVRFAYGEDKIPEVLKIATKSAEKILKEHNVVEDDHGFRYI